MKKTIGLLSLIALFALGSVQDAAAQFVFFNGTSCNVAIYLGYTDGPNPCFVTSQTCETGWIPVGPGVNFIPGPPCYFPWSGPAQFFGFKINVAGNYTSVDLCGNPNSVVANCLGGVSQVNIAPNNFGSVF